jgi:uncharacterized protein
MKYYKPPLNLKFVGREKEIGSLKKIESRKKSSLVVVHGRRRVGKTELIEQYFRESNLLKFEGLQLNSTSQTRERTSECQAQINHCIATLGRYAGQEALFKSVKCQNWSEFFELLTPFVSAQKVTLYFEETQWLASYKDEFCARMKPYWDDIWRHNSNLTVVLSGSSPSFLVSQFLANKALYNRSNDLIQLEPFTLEEVNQYLGRLGKKEKLLAICSVGGIPEYLNRIMQNTSILNGLCEESFTKNGYFVDEYNRVFVSSLSESFHYRKVIELLSDKTFLTSVCPKNGILFF